MSRDFGLRLGLHVYVIVLGMWLLQCYCKELDLSTGFLHYFSRFPVKLYMRQGNRVKWRSTGIGSVARINRRAKSRFESKQLHVGYVKALRHLLRGRAGLSWDGG